MTEETRAPDLSHFTMVADGAITSHVEDYNIPPGPYVLSLDVWAEDAEQAVDILFALCEDTQFKIADQVDVSGSEPRQEHEGAPVYYNLVFTPILTS